MPKYVGDSMATVSPGWQMARRDRLMASRQPQVVTNSSGVRVHPAARVRWATWMRRASQPGGMS